MASKAAIMSKSRKKSGALKKSSFVSLLTYIRDCIIFFLPIRRLPKFFRVLFWGVDAQFVFFVHPRRTEDIFIALPFLKIVRLFFSKNAAFHIIAKLPPFVLAHVKDGKGNNGLVVSDLLLPDSFFTSRRRNLIRVKQGMKFCAKIVRTNGSVGLGGWWPIITRRGLILQKDAKQLNIRITNGHCGTLVSIYLMIEKISFISGIPMSEMNITIIGAGKMGTNVMKIFMNKIHKLLIIDKNHSKLNKIAQDFGIENTTTKIEYYPVYKNQDILKSGFSKSHLCICTTSNVRRIMKPRDLPPRTIVIDDSRPEAFTRSKRDDADMLILEGGLMKIKGLTINYDFGFGLSENVFGCLAESYILSIASPKEILPTLGDVDFLNFERMLQLCQNGKINVGDFLSADRKIPESTISNFVRRKMSGYSLAS